jgi:very-long-chain (3R)-3-hydroxyacyl-CoA dehydratase
MAGVGSALRRLYLSVYNWVVFVGWSVPRPPAALPLCSGWIFPVLLLCPLLGLIRDVCWISWFCRAQVLYYAVLVLRKSGHEAVYAAVERPLQFAQTAAIMEVCRFLFVYLSFLLHFYLVVYFSFCYHCKSCELGAIGGFCLAH